MSGLTVPEPFTYQLMNIHEVNVYSNCNGVRLVSDRSHVLTVIGEEVCLKPLHIFVAIAFDSCDSHQNCGR